jgi:hypothetical protein
MANQFDVAVPSVLQSLMAGEQSFKEARASRMQDQLTQARQGAVQLMQNGDQKSALAMLMGAGDVQGAQTLANIGNSERDFAFRSKEADRSQGNTDRSFGLQEKEFGQTAARDSRDFAFRQQESGRAQGNADRSYGLQKTELDATLQGGKVPAGFTQTPTGLKPIPGGPEDPDYLRSKNEAVKQPRNMSITDITKLSEEGGKLASLVRFADSFKNEYAGYGISNIGGAAMAAGRNFPGLVSKNTADAATFWQDYDRYKNAVRHDLFGSALTATESAQWNKADIDPGQDPATIRRNLKIQKDIIEAGVKRKASAMVQQDYDPKTIGAAYGVDLGAMGVNTQGRRGGVGGAPAGGAAPPSGSPAPPPGFQLVK